MAPFRYLLPQLRGKDALVVLSEHGAELRGTPADLPFPTLYRLDFDGTVTKRKVDVKIAFDSRGDLEFLARTGMLNVTPSKLTEAMTLGAKRTSPDSGVSFTDLKWGDPFDTTKPFHMQVHLNADLPEPRRPRRPLNRLPPCSAILTRMTH